MIVDFVVSIGAADVPLHIRRAERDIAVFPEGETDGSRGLRALAPDTPGHVAKTTPAPRQGCQNFSRSSRICTPLTVETSRLRDKMKNQSSRWPLISHESNHQVQHP